jgi:hypothetical protein
MTACACGLLFGEVCVGEGGGFKPKFGLRQEEIGVCMTPVCRESWDIDRGRRIAGAVSYLASAGRTLPLHAG